MYKKYGGLSKTWQEDLRAGFAECFRVLQQDGILIFKWNEDQIKTSEVLKLAERKPLFGHPSGKAAKTHWLCFMKTYLTEEEMNAGLFVAEITEVIHMILLDTVVGKVGTIVSAGYGKKLA